MEKITSFADAEQKILADIRRCIASIRSIAGPDVESVSKGIAALLRMRQVAYEDLNQIQHEELVLRAAISLQDLEFPEQNLDWYWNPRQTGDASEPDLQAKTGTRVVLSAEITASERPIGTIDVRMGRTLAKLRTMPGRRFYFVRTNAMEKRAKTKVSKAGHSIEVRKI